MRMCINDRMSMNNFEEMVKNEESSRAKQCETFVIAQVSIVVRMTTMYFISNC
jgi:hypothetical protein